MEFHQKLQELRKQRNLTQEELAAALYVSRTAISKWESGRGYPSIDSLKAIATFYGVSVDALLSGDQLLTIAQVETQQKTARQRDLVFGLLDVSVVLLMVLPFWAAPVNWVVRCAYVAVVMVTALFGVATLLFQNCHNALWNRYKDVASVFLSVVGVLLFILSPQPYAAAFLFLFLVIKVCLLLKK